MAMISPYRPSCVPPVIKTFEPIDISYFTFKSSPTRFIFLPIDDYS